MNYLAHIYFSGDEPQIQIGNFIGDFVKGKQHQNYPVKMQQGILMHRKIDTFTDQHPVFKASADIIRNDFGRYSGIIIDMYYDYFLARDFREHTSLSLNAFTKRFYGHTILNYKYLPDRVKNFIFHFISTNRLNKYASQQGLHDSLKIMQKHKTTMLDPDAVIHALQQNHDELEALFRLFLPDLKQFAESELLQIKSF